ncbi:DUF7537 family lipoprotein [Halospeciosus flavus]|uniref:Outer membrane lipoprotein-sorting protein n=1 Tax=Halospeciosus flavus TaxID=3032283 RepID=A0ABD5Z5X0_9EURY|nr:hypothetical protein [Halospeciosus flavus]
MRTLQAIALAAILVLSGCAGIGGPSAPVQTTETTQAPPPSQLPGVTEKGVTDPAELLSTHAEVLQRSSYTLQSNVTETYANGTLYASRTESTTYGSSDTHFTSHITAKGPGTPFLGTPAGEVAYWSNESVILRATEPGADGETNYARLSQPPELPHEDYYERLYVIFSSMETKLAGTTTGPNGQTLHVVESTTVQYPNQLAPTEKYGNVSNVSFTARIASNGVVRSYELTYTVTLDGKRLTVHESMQISKVGDATVDRPSWVDTALEKTS